MRILIRQQQLLTASSSSDEPRSAFWLLSLIYANRSISLWKIPETLAWLSTTVQSIDTLQSSNRPSLFSNSNDADAIIKSIIRHAIVSDMKPLAPFVGSLHALHGPQDGYDIVPPKGEGVTVYDEAYFSTANAETAKKRREGRTAGQRRGRGRGGQNERIEIDPTEFLQMLEDVLAFEMEPQRRDDVLRALQEGPGANVVLQLEVMFQICPFGCPASKDPPLLALGSSAPGFRGTISKCQGVSFATSRAETPPGSRSSRSRGWTAE